MPRERRVDDSPDAATAGFDRLVEFVNFALALVIMAAAWTLVVELLGWAERRTHGHR